MLRSIDSTKAATGVIFTDEFRGSENIYSIQLSGTWVANVAVEISNDGTNWISTVGATHGQGGVAASNPLTANGIYVFMAQSRYMRVNVTSYTSGTVNINYSVGSGWLR